MGVTKDRTVAGGEGNFDERGLSFDLRYEGRDDPINPRSGHRLSFSHEVASLDYEDSASVDRTLSSVAITGEYVTGMGGAFALVVKSGFSGVYSSEGRARMNRLSCFNVRDLYEAIDETIPPGSVILSDPVTSYCIPAVTDQFVACTYDQHSIPNDSTALDRILDCRDLFLPGTSVSRAVGTMKQYGSQYLAVNGRVPRSVTPMYWKPNREIAEQARVIEPQEDACVRMIPPPGISGNSRAGWRMASKPGGSTTIRNDTLPHRPRQRPARLTRRAGHKGPRSGLDW